MTVLENFSASRSRIFSRIADLFTELRKNRRAAAGITAIAVLLGGYGLLMLNDADDALRRNLIEDNRRLQRLAADRDAKDWPARAAASAGLRTALEKRLWPADSDGVARADLQDWVTANGREAGLERIRVSIELTRPKGFSADLREVIATIGAVPTETTLSRFLDRIEREPHLLVVDRLHVQQHPVAALEMTLIAYARIVRADSPPR